MIAIVNNHPPPSAICRYAENLYSSFCPNASLFNVILHRSQESLDYLGHKITGIHFPSLRIEGAMNYLLYPHFLTKIHHAICEHVDDLLIHIVSPDIPPMHHSGPSAVTIHDNPLMSLKTDLYNFPIGYVSIVKRNFRLFEREHYSVTVSSEYVKKGLEDFGFSEKIFVVPHPVRPIFKPPSSSDKTNSKIDLGLPLDKKLVLSVSSGIKRKNIQILSSVMDNLGSEYRLVRVGPAVGNSITYSSVKDVTLKKLYNACDVLISPSLEEGFDIPVIEALASGLPVVASDIGVHRETAEGCAIFADPQDARALSRAVIESIGALDDLRFKGLKRAEFYSMAKFTQNMTKFYAQLRILV